MRMASIMFGQTDKASVVLSAPVVGAPTAGNMAVMVGVETSPAATLGEIMKTVNDCIEQYISRVSKIETSFTSSKVTTTVVGRKTDMTTSLVSAALLAETDVGVGFTAAAAGFEANRSELMHAGFTQCRNVLKEFLTLNVVAGIGT